MANYIYGKNVVRQRILSNKKIHRLFFNQKHPDTSLLELAKKHAIPYELVQESFLNKIDLHHQGIVAEIDAYKIFDLEEVLKDLKENATFVILDGLEDPHNLGAILRSADASGVDAIIIPKHGSVTLNATVAKVSTGAIETVKTVMVTNLNQCIDTLKKAGFWIYASEYSEKAVLYRLVKFANKCAIIIGSEGQGISRLVLKNADVIVKIPMLGEVNSLNASVSAALLMYEVLAQRQPQ